MSFLSLIALLTSSPLAHAQEAFGLSQGAQSGGLLDAPTASAAEGPRAGGWVLSGLTSHALAPAQNCVIDPSEDISETCGTQANPWIRSGTDLLLSGAYGLGARLSVGGETRARLRTVQPDAPGDWPNDTLAWSLDGADAAGIEDLSLYAQLGLLPAARRSQLALQVRGHLDFDAPEPEGGAATGAADVSWLYGGGTGLSPTAVFTTRGARRPGEVWPAWQFTTDVALTLAREGAARESLPIEPALQGRGAAAIRIRESLAWLAEGELSLGSVAKATSTELRSGVRWRPRPRLELVGLLGTSPTLALGDPAIRLVGGIRWVPDAPPPLALPAQGAELTVSLRDPGGEPLIATLGGDLEGLVRRSGPEGELILAAPEQRKLRVALGAEGQATWTETLTLEGPGPWRIERVLPAGGGDASLDLSLLDVDGQPIDAAQVTLDGQDLGTVCGSCEVVLDGLPSGEATLHTDAPHFGARSQQVALAPLDPQALRPGGVYLTRPPGSVHLRVRDPRGPLPKATLQIIRATGVEPVGLDAAGEQWLTLDPGRYRVRVSAEGMGAQERTLSIGEEDLHLHELDFQLFPAQPGGASLSVRAESTEGEPVEGVEVRLDDRTIGRTGSGGTARFEDLADGQIRVGVAHPYFRPYAEQVVALTPGADAELIAPLSWLPGQVDIDVVNEDALPVDATVRISRGGKLEAVDRTGPDGKLHAALEPGSYALSMTAPGRTDVTLDLEVAATRDEQIRATAVLNPRDPDDARVALQVLDRADQPVEGAAIFLDDAQVGTTSTGGRLTLQGLPAGEQALRVTGDFYDPWTGQLQALTGAEADSEVVAHLKERLGVVHLQARTRSGDPVDAYIRLLGPTQARPRRLGADGAQRFRLTEGPWEILFSNEQYGFYGADLDVDRRTRSYEVTWTTPDIEEPAPIAPLPRRPATIAIRDRADDAPVAGTLRLLGPEILAPVDVGAEGNWAGELRVGSWEVLATAEKLGIGGGDLDVTASGPPAELVIALGEARVEVTDEQVAIREAIYFEVDRAVIEGRSSSLIEEVARTLRSQPEIQRVRIEGHTDSQGSAAHNLDLSERRAEAVREALVELGVELRRLETAGFGDTQPVDGNATEEGRAANRRVVFQVLQVRESSVAAPKPEGDGAP